MTPMEKAEKALNDRIEHVQVRLRETASEATRRSLVHGLVVSIGIGETITDLVGKIGEYAKRRFRELKEEQATLTREHAELLSSGGQLLEQFKANPADRALKKEIERTQRSMEIIQKRLRRSADTLQSELAPSVGVIDKVAVAVRQLCENEEREVLKRSLKTLLDEVQGASGSGAAPSGESEVDITTWKASALAAIDGATDYYDAFAQAGYQTMVALQVLADGLSEAPPTRASEVAERANTGVSQRITAITARLTAP